MLNDPQKAHLSSENNSVASKVVVLGQRMDLFILFVSCMYFITIVD